MRVLMFQFRYGEVCYQTGASHPDNVCQSCYNGAWNKTFPALRDSIFDKVKNTFIGFVNLNREGGIVIFSVCLGKLDCKYCCRRES